MEDVRACQEKHYIIGFTLQVCPGAGIDTVAAVCCEPQAPAPPPGLTCPPLPYGAVNVAPTGSKAHDCECPIQSLLLIPSIIDPSLSTVTSQGVSIYEKNVLLNNVVFIISLNKILHMMTQV